MPSRQPADEHARDAGGARAGPVLPRGTLYVVATPIGNLGDVTIRALEVLRAVPLIAAEDTRIARRLLARYDIATRTTSYHARSGPGRLAELLGHLAGGADLALVTDAGTPGVSDPGEELVGRWVAEGGNVVPIPGPSAAAAAISATAIAGPRWSFEGFLPRSGRDRRDRLERLARDERGAVLYEAPGRVAATLRDLAAACGGERPAAVCRELTKLHEQIVTGTLAELVTAVEAGTIPARGEAVVVLGARPGDSTARRADEATAASRARASEGPDLAAARAEVERLVAGGAGRAQAAREVAVRTGLPRRALYGAGTSDPVSRKR